MKTTVKIEGLSELDAALGALPKATARNVLKRALKKAGEPIAAEARRLAPVDEGHLRDSIVVSPRLKNRAGLAEFSAALRSGASKEAATRALRDARRAAAGSKSFAETYVGAGPLPQAHLVEFGTVNMAAQPFLRPAFDREKAGAARAIRDELADAIEKAAARLERKAARLAAKGGAR